MGICGSVGQAHTPTYTVLLLALGVFFSAVMKRTVAVSCSLQQHPFKEVVAVDRDVPADRYLILRQGFPGSSRPQSSICAQAGT